MTSRTLFASTLTVCLLSIGFLGLAATADGASAARRARTYVMEGEGHRRGPTIFLPIGPTYNFYDYPYYYSRGYYPTHIVHYVYYPSYSRVFYPTYGSRCSYRHRRCIAR